MDLLIPSDSDTVEMVQVIPSTSQLLYSNIQQFNEIQKYHVQHPHLSIDQAGIEWIENHAAAWRANHPII